MSSLPNVIHFNCQSCGMLLTVPKEMAGVTGPCPHCRATITSPAAPAQAQLPGPSWPMAENAVTAPVPQATASVPVAPANSLPAPLPPPAPAPTAPAVPPVSPTYAAQPQPPQQQPQPLPQYPPSWPAAGALATQSVPVAAPVAAPAPAPAPQSLPAAVTTPAPAPASAPVSALDLMSQPPGGAPSSSWEAANPPQVSPLPPAVGGGVMNPAWPPAGVELPAPQLPAPPGSAHPVMDSVLQMPSVHQPPFPPVPPPRTSPLTPPGGSAAAQRFKSSRGYSTSRKGPAVLAVLMALMAFAGTAWFFRDQLRLAWTTHMAAREAEAEALEFHPTPPAPDSSSATPSNTFNPAGDPPSPGKTGHGTGTGEVATTPPDAPPATVSGDGASTPEQVQRPTMASGNPETAPSPAPTPSTPEVAPAPAPAPAPTPSPTPGATAPPPQPAAPNLVEVPSPESQNPAATAANPGTAPSNKAVAVPAEPLIADVSPEARPALEVLQQFLTAATWEDRLKVVQGAELMRPLMQSYYGSMPDGPLHVSKIGLIRHDKSPQTGPPHCVFQIGGGDLKRPLPIMVEQTPEGWRVDWLTFTEFKDNLLARFMESPQEGPKRFHVLVRRTHYFDDNVPELDKKICVEVQSPMPPFVGSVFAHKGTAVSNILDRYLGWQVDQAAAVVELEWRREGDQQWVELTNLPQFNWRNAIAGEVVPPPHATPTTPVAVPATKQ